MKQQAKLWTLWVARTVKFIGHFMLVQAAGWNIVPPEICGCRWGGVRRMYTIAA